MLKKPCPYHKGSVNHTLEQCKMLRKYYNRVVHKHEDKKKDPDLLSFLDAYSGYHQIKMKESDQLATSFIIPFGMYFYITMPFVLRNAGATYQ